MKRWRQALADEQGLTLVELLAGLILFGTVITMLYGVLLSGYSLKDKVTRQNTLNNHADVLVNQVMLALRNADEVEDVTDLLHAKDPDIISALWTQQYEERGTKNQRRVYYLYLVTADGSGTYKDASGSISNIPHYKLLREKYVPEYKIRSFLTIRDISRMDGTATPDEEGSTQLSDPRFPLVANGAGKPFSLGEEAGYAVKSQVTVNLTLTAYNPENSEATDSAPFSFKSQFSIK